MSIENSIIMEFSLRSQNAKFFHSNSMTKSCCELRIETQYYLVPGTGSMSQGLIPRSTRQSQSDASHSDLLPVQLYRFALCTLTCTPTWYWSTLSSSASSTVVLLVESGESNSRNLVSFHESTRLRFLPPVVFWFQRNHFQLSLPFVSKPNIHTNNNMSCV